jgi:mannose-6-phosphate isomerase-like protein (cupin superfamily)
MHITIRQMRWLSIAVLLSTAGLFAADGGPLQAKVVKLDAGGKKELQVLSGPPESVTMRSGLVVLQPDQSVGKHSTGEHEELLVILEGQGEMIFKDGFTLPAEAQHALYCPPETEHNVRNTGTGVLRYVYIVASTRGAQ